MSKNPFIKKSERLFFVLICLGMVLVGIGSIFEGYGIDSRFFEFVGGFGTALIGIGAVCLIRFRRKPVSAKQQEIDKNDERSIMLREKSAFSAYFITMLCLLAAVIVFLVLDMWQAIVVTICVMAIHVVSYLVLLHVNNKKL